MPLIMQRTVTGGQEDLEQEFDSHYSQERYSPNYSDYGYAPSESYTPWSEGNELGEKGKKGGGSGGGKPSKEGTASKEKKEKSKEEKKKSEKTEEAINRLLGELEEKFKSINLFIEEHELLKKIKQHVLDSKQPVDQILAGYSISTLEKRIEDCANHITLIMRKLKDVDNDTYNFYIDTIRKLYTTYKKPTDLLMKDLESLHTDWASLKRTVTPEKQYAYFKEAVTKQVDLSEKDGITEKKQEKNTVSHEKNLEKKEETLLTNPIKEEPVKNSLSYEESVAINKAQREKEEEENKQLFEDFGFADTEVEDLYSAKEKEEQKAERKQESEEGQRKKTAEKAAAKANAEEQEQKKSETKPAGQKPVISPERIQSSQSLFDLLDALHLLRKTINNLKNKKPMQEVKTVPQTSIKEKEM